MKTKLSRIMFQIFNKTGLRPVSTRFILMVFLALSPAPPALSQIPQGFNYQAIARDGSGNPISDPINVKIAILSDDVPETVIWEELHSGVDPNENGLFSIVVGQGTWQEGLASFSLIDWTVTPLYIRTKINDVKLGISQLWAVPYAMVADSLGGPLKKLKVEAEATSSLDEALFEVKNKTGQTVFAVYNEGVRIYVDDGAKGPKGGFSVGGFGTEKGISQPLLVVNPDSIRAYVYDDPLSKTPKGGFAVGGFDALKGETNEYLMVSPDCVRVYIDDGAKAPKGGFAVGGFGTSKGVAKFLNVTPDSTRILTGDSEKGFGVGNLTTGISESYLKITPQNYFIGHEAGKNNIYNQLSSKGEKNIFIGYQAGLSNISGRYNTFLGYQAGTSNTGSDNTFIGYLAGKSHQSKGGNVYIGSRAGENSTEGEQNVLIGESSGSYITTGKYNIMMGFASGNSNKSGTRNVFLGLKAGFTNDTASYNVFVGTQSGYSNINGHFNTFMGYQSGYNNFNGDKNVFLGYQAGYTNWNSFNNVFIGNQSGYSNQDGYDNVFMGSESGLLNTTGDNNVFIGKSAGRANTTGGSNVILGMSAGLYNESGSSNLMFGNMAGYYNKTGNNNVFLGYKAGFQNFSGNNNIYLGYEVAGQYSGTGDSPGSNNVFLGNQAGGQIYTGNSNVLVGNQAGQFISGYAGPYDPLYPKGCFNVFMGTEAGKNNAYGFYNVFLGHQAGFSNFGDAFSYSLKGTGNVYIGYQSAYYAEAGQQNTFLGYQSGYYARTTSSALSANVYLGYRAGYSSSGNSNVIIGDRAGTGTDGSERTANGNFNIMIGEQSGAAYTSAHDNTLIGVFSGSQIVDGNNNVCIGNMSGYSLRTNATGNVFIGYQSGFNETYISNKLFIDNSSTSTPLIWGDFTTGARKLQFNGDVAIGAVNEGNALYTKKSVAGHLVQFINTGNTASGGGIIIAAGMNGSTAGPDYISFYSPDKLTYHGAIRQSAAGIDIYNPSDIRLKENIVNTRFGISDLMKIKVRDYTLIVDETSSIQTGFVAQELYEAYPLAVGKPLNPDDFWAVDYGKVTPIIIKSIQDQQYMIELLQEENRQLKAKNDDLQQRLERIEVLLQSDLKE